MIRPSALGDVCRSVPVLVSLRKAWPSATIDWLVQDSFVEAVSAHPDVSKVIAFPRARFARVASSLSALREFRAWRRDLAARRYDIVFDCQGLARSGFFTWLTRAPRRIGYADAREGAGLFYTRRVAVPDSLHTVERMLALVQAEGVEPVRDLRLYAPSEAATRWRQRAQTLGLQGTRTLVLAPTSRWPAKRWPDARFAELLSRLDGAPIDAVLIVGAGSEREQCPCLLEAAESGSSRLRVVNLTGETTIGELMAVIASATLVVANDSAALHMAVGFDRPYVALFGPTETARVGPYGGRGVVLQHVEHGESLHHKSMERSGNAMERISVNEVLGAVERLLSESGGSGEA